MTPHDALITSSRTFADGLRPSIIDVGVLQVGPYFVLLLWLLDSRHAFSEHQRNGFSCSHCGWRHWRPLYCSLPSPPRPEQSHTGRYLRASRTISRDRSWCWDWTRRRQAVPRVRNWTPAEQDLWLEEWGLDIISEVDNGDYVITVPSVETETVRNTPVSRSELLDLLKDAIRDHNATSLHTNKCCSSVEDLANHVKIHFKDGTSAVADLMIACDGIHSAIRAQYATDKPVYVV